MAQNKDILLSSLCFDAAGLVPVIAQDADTEEVLMLAWMNAEAIEETLKTGRVCYYSRSRKALWRKGERSGQTQTLVEMRLDCDGDVLLVRVKQKGVACHTGHKSCFFRKVEGKKWIEDKDVIIPEEELYAD